ncbi:amidase [Aquabacterium sp.]|uniref:amidase n=1 Tax=Aquabacterium sp. TaxID=1872578 RepID=UPI002CE1513F|nr:amidase [Aquabacterium sp.]HSW05759.1 amidase [Aquabacterium sp.]
MDTQVNPKSIAAGTLSAAEALSHALAVADSPACRHVFVRRFDAGARATAAAIDTLRTAGLPLPPLAGVPVSIKDLFDVAGQPTTAASRAMADAVPAARDCGVIACLRAAGAVLVGHTNMSEFAFSGVGINPHHGTPRHPVSATGEALIPGGSTSGGAVSVATGASWAALGSDTGGSIRIPAALQGLVGFKNTQRLTPLDGSVPLSSTLDTACAITRSVADAVLVHGVLAGQAPRLATRPLHAMRFAVPTTVMLDTLEPAVADAFNRALSALSTSGAQIEQIALPALSELAGLQAQGGFAAAESWAWHRHRLAEREADYDPRVAQRIRRGAQISAADYLDLQQARRAWIARVEQAMQGFDALLSPTVPIVAPAIAPLIASDELFFRTNALLLRNPSVVNMLDGCALSLPCHAPGGLPVGLMVWGPALADDAVLGASLAIEAALRAAELGR